MDEFAEPSNGSVVLDAEGDAWQVWQGEWVCAHAAKRRDPVTLSWQELNVQYGPTRVIFDRLAAEVARIRSAP